MSSYINKKYYARSEHRESLDARPVQACAREPRHIVANPANPGLQPTAAVVTFDVLPVRTFELVIVRGSAAADYWRTPPASRGWLSLTALRAHRIDRYRCPLPTERASSSEVAVIWDCRCRAPP
jgi:hypothetical protein